jgi:peptidyl-prolyl cis-trans isomerase SurA
MLRLLHRTAYWRRKDGHSTSLSGLAILLALIVAACPLTAHAQFNNGAIIVTVPSSEDSTASPTQAKPKAAPKSRPKPRTATKPKRKAKRRQHTAATKPRLRRPTARRTKSSSKLKIAILVNDDPITEYEISQRAAMLAGGAGLNKRVQSNFRNLIKRKSTNNRLRAILKQTIDSNPGRSRKEVLAIFNRKKKQFAISLQRQALGMARKSILPGLRQKASKALIDERLKIQAARKAKALISKKRLDQIIQGIAKRNNLSHKAFKAQLKRQGTDINAFRSRIRAQASWGRLINAKFGRFIDVNQKTIDESVFGGTDAAKVSLKLQRFIFKLPAKLDQRIMARRLVEADQFRARFTGCANSRRLVQGTKNVIYQDLGYKVASSLQEPTRSLLLNSRDGEMLPPLTTGDGVALYAVCARRAGTKSFAARAAAERKLRQTGTEVYGRKYLSDLRREAHIEYRKK